MLIVVATDETASDVELLEQALQVCRREQARVFVLGRPAVLGSGKSFVLWREPVSNRTYRIALQQGVSAAGQELLNWDGIGPLMTVVPDAFGPYPLSRLASETNGLMMQLPMSGFRKPPDYEAAAYAPGLQSRREWEQLIAKSRFRSAIREVVTKLNPHLDKKLSLKQTGYSTELADFRKEAVRESEKVAYAIPLIQRAITLLDDVEVFHDQEGSRRWQANYDLTRAQCHLFQLRLINALIALDGRAVSQTATDGSDDKMLNLAITREVNEPTAEQAPRLQKLLRLSGSPEEFAAELKSQQQEALRLLNSVQANHPRTPWSRVARTELKRGFGVRLLEVVRPPRVKRPIKVPVL